MIQTYVHDAARMVLEPLVELDMKGGPPTWVRRIRIENSEGVIIHESSVFFRRKEDAVLIE